MAAPNNNTTGPYPPQDAARDTGTNLYPNKEPAVNNTGGIGPAQTGHQHDHHVTSAQPQLANQHGAAGDPLYNQHTHNGVPATYQSHAQPASGVALQPQHAGYANYPTVPGAPGGLPVGVPQAVGGGYGTTGNKPPGGYDVPHQPGMPTGNPTVKIALGKLEQAAGALLSSETMKAKGLEKEIQGQAMKQQHLHARRAEPMGTHQAGGLRDGESIVQASGPGVGMGGTGMGPVAGRVV